MSKNSDFMSIFVEKGIFEDRLDFVKDFFFTLLHTIDKSHIGDNYLKTTTVRKEHFDWALNKIIKFYESKGIKIRSNDKFSRELFKYFNEDYYTQDSKNRKDIFLRKYKKVLTIDSENSMKSVKTLEQIYNLVEKNMGD